MKLRTLTIRGLPEPVLRALRAAAKANRRSLNAEVLVLLEAAAEEAAVPSQAAARRRPGTAKDTPRVREVREPGAPPYEVRRSFEEARAAQLESDLKLSPEERVRLADRMLDDALATRPRPNVHTIRAFDTWEDYLAWKRTDFLP